MSSAEFRPFFCHSVSSFSALWDLGTAEKLCPGTCGESKREVLKEQGTNDIEHLRQYHVLRITSHLYKLEILNFT